jgi:hypothetical protein
MRQIRFVFPVLSLLAVLMIPAQQAAAQTSANANAQAQASANAKANVDAQKKADAATKAAAEKKAQAETKAQSQVDAAAQKKADAQAQAKTAAQASAAAQSDVRLNKPSWQTVMDKLFGTPENGLLDGQKSFDFRADSVILTSAQSDAFFNGSSSTSLSALIEGAEALHGQIRMEGTIDGAPFELKLAGRELKIAGLTLTAAQRDALVTELKGIDGLHEAKIAGMIDGRASVINLAGGHERIELLGRDNSDRGEGKRVEVPARVDLEHKTEINTRADIDRGGRVETSGRSETSGRVEIPEKPVRSVLGGK